MSQAQPERTTTGVIIEELAKPFKDQSPLAFLVHAREILQEVIEGRPVTSSRIVAEYFGKKHSDVVRSIVNTIAIKPELEASRNFAQWSEQVEIGSGAKRSVTGYWMDRKGFAILAMGFTGAKALDFKCAFYDEFERMEKALHPTYEYTDGERNCDQYMIRKAVAKRAKASSVHYQTIYNALYDRYRISSYKQLRHDQIREAMTFIECFDLKPQLEAAPSIGPKDIVLKEEEITAILVFIYYWTRLFREPLEIFYASLAAVQSPYAPRFYEALHGMRLSSLEKRLAQHGRTLDELPVYQHWLAGQAA